MTDSFLRFVVLFLLAAGLLACGPSGTDVPAEVATGGIQDQFSRMGITATVQVRADRAQTLRRTAAISRTYFETHIEPFDFTEGGEAELTRLNRLANDIRVPISRNLRWAFMQASRLHNQTGGLIDITAYPLQIIYGFDSDKEDISLPPEVIEATLGVVNQDLVRIDNDAIVFDSESVHVDFAPILAGFLLDRTILDIRQTDIPEIWMRVNNCIRVHAMPTAAPWPHEIHDPFNPDALLGTMYLDYSAAAAWTERDSHTRRVNGTPTSCYINPRNGLPATDHAKALVIGPTATMAQAFSQAFLFDADQTATNLMTYYPRAEAMLVQEFPEKRIFVTDNFRGDLSLMNETYPVTIWERPAPQETETP